MKFIGFQTVFEYACVDSAFVGDQNVLLSWEPCGFVSFALSSSSVEA